MRTASQTLYSVGTVVLRDMRRILRTRLRASCNASSTSAVVCQRGNHTNKFSQIVHQTTITILEIKRKYNEVCQMFKTIQHIERSQMRVSPRPWCVIVT